MIVVRMRHYYKERDKIVTRIADLDYLFKNKENTCDVRLAFGDFIKTLTKQKALEIIKDIASDYYLSGWKNEGLNSWVSKLGFDGWEYNVGLNQQAKLWLEWINKECNKVESK